MSNAGATDTRGLLAPASRGYALSLAWLLAAVVTFAGGKLERLALSYDRQTISPRDTYDAMAQDHYALRLGLFFAIFAAIYATLPWVTGYAVSRVLGWTHFALAVVGVSLSFWSLLAIRIFVVPNRFADLADALAVISTLSAIGPVLAWAGFIVFVITVAEAMLRKRPRIAP